LGVFLKAAVYRGPGRIVIEDVPEPNVSGQKILVRFKAGSICGTDLHFFRGEWKSMKLGRVIGHDACGVRVDTGERVVMVPVIYCGKCYFCMRGLQSLCTRGKFIGLNRDGFFAEFTSLRAKYLVPLPVGVSDEEGAMMEPVALALHVLDSLKPNTGDWVTIIGQGPIGLLMTQIASIKGCRVIAVDREEYRLEISRKFGATSCINASSDDSVKKVREMTENGSDIVIEAAGTIKTVEQTPLLVRKAGKVALVGEFEGYMNLNNADEALISTSYISPVEYPMAVSLVENKTVDVKGLVTHRFKLTDFEEATKTANDPSKKPLKVIITE
jgi:(R,R)-butanediol dehydrogenase/meso-butanediol dehydrogenase/diacetyl reductase